MKITSIFQNYYVELFCCNCNKRFQITNDKIIEPFSNFIRLIHLRCPNCNFEIEIGTDIEL